MYTLSYVYICIYICLYTLIAHAVPLALAAPGNAQRRCHLHAEFIVRVPSAAAVKKNKLC